MKIAICAKEEGLKSEIDERFGRAEYFIIVDTLTNEITAIENNAKNDSGGAGGRAVRLLAEKDVEAVIVPELGPKATTALKAFDMQAYKKGEIKTVEDAITAFNKNELEKLEIATVEEHSGLRRA